MRERIQRFFREKGWRQMKKSDWVVVALVGVLLLIIAMPSGESDRGILLSDDGAKQGTAVAEEEGPLIKAGQTGEGDGDSYVQELEERLAKILSRMDGVGEVEVMITLEDSGETVVEKDSKSTTSTTTESDISGGSRTVTSGESSVETLYVEADGESYPYVKKEKLPSVSGVVVVAEGAGSPAVVSDISKTVEALFSVEAHKIMVVKMSSKEDGR